MEPLVKTVQGLVKSGSKEFRGLRKGVVKSHAYKAYAPVVAGFITTASRYLARTWRKNPSFRKYAPVGVGAVALLGAASLFKRG